MPDHIEHSPVAMDGDIARAAGRTLPVDTDEIQRWTDTRLRRLTFADHRVLRQRSSTLWLGKALILSVAAIFLYAIIAILLLILR